MAERVELALVVPSARREGGGDVWLDGLLRHLPSLGVRPLVVFDEPGELVDAAAGYGCRPVVATGAGLAGVLRAAAPGVVVFWSPRAQVYGSAALREAGLRTRTAWVQHVLPSGFPVHREASALPADSVLCVSAAVARLQGLLYPGTPVRVVHPGIDPASPVLRLVARRRLGCDVSDRVVGLVGRVEPWKGHDIAVRMLRHLVVRVPDARLVLIGERRSPTWPAFAGQVTSLVHQLGLEDRVIFAGHVDGGSALLSALDVLVCASREEGFGLAVVEAMAAGVPVLATRCGGPQDLLDDGRTGLLVPKEDPVALSRAVTTLLRDAPFAAALAGRAREVYRRRFTAVCSTRRLLRAVAEVAGSTTCG